MLCDLLWADPVDNDKGYLSDLYVNNEVRGCSYYFGQEAANKFLRHNNLVSVIRGHEP